MMTEIRYTAALRRSGHTVKRVEVAAGSLHEAKVAAEQLFSDLPPGAQKRSWHVAVFDTERASPTPAATWRFDLAAWEDHRDMTASEQAHWDGVIRAGTHTFRQAE